MSDVFGDREKALENEYIRRKDREALEKLREKMKAERDAEEASTPGDGATTEDTARQDEAG